MPSTRTWNHQQHMLIRKSANMHTYHLWGIPTGGKNCYEQLLSRIMKHLFQVETNVPLIMLHWDTTSKRVWLKISSLDRYSARLNLTQKVGKYGEVGANMMFTQMNQEIERGTRICHQSVPLCSHDHESFNDST